MEGVFKSDEGRQEILNMYRSILDGWGCEWRRIDVETEYGRTAVITVKPLDEEAGAPPLVLLHGSGSNSAAWGGDIVEYARHFRVFAVDIPGEAGFSEPARFSCHDGSFTLWLDQVRDGLGLETAYFCGQSLGGWAALQYAIDNPIRVGGVCAISPSGLAPAKKGYLLRMLWLMLQGERGMEKLIRLLHNSDKGEIISSEEREIFRLLSRYFVYRREEPAVFTPEELTSLSAPVMYLAGAQDIMLDTEASLAYARKYIGRLETRIYPDGGHALVGLSQEVVPFFRNL